MLYNKAPANMQARVLKLVEKNKDISRTEIIQKVKDLLEVTLTGNELSAIFAEIRANLLATKSQLEWAIDALNKEEKPAYEVVEFQGADYYLLSTKEQTFKIPVSQIDEIFHDFSSKGKNMSGEEVRQKYKLQPKAWEAIKRKLSLYKTSHVLSPHTLSKLSDSEEAEAIDEAIADHIDTKVDKFKNTYDKQFKKRATEALKIQANFEYRLEMLQKAIVDHEPMELDFEPNYKPNWKESHFILTDIHIWKGDTKWIINRLDQMYQDIISNPAETIHITCLWDLVETFAESGMHQGQVAYWTEQEYGYGFDLIMNTVGIFEKWLAAIARSWKKVYFKWLGGNHDRLTTKNEDDIYRTWALVVYELIKRGVSNLGVEVVYFKEHINTFITDNIQYIISHWEGPFSKQKPEQIIVAHAKVWLYTVLLSWHTHALQFTEWKNFTKVVVPAMAGAGQYDTRLNLHSEPAYLRVDRNRNNTADISVVRL